MQPLDFIKTAYDVLQKANRLDLAEQLTGLREDLLNLREENLELKEENENLKQQLRIKSKIVYEQGICWIEEDEMTKDKSKTPICPQCWQVEGIVNRLPIQVWGQRPGIQCASCKRIFHLK